MTSLLAFSLFLGLGMPATPIPTVDCSFGRARTISESSSLADQLRCYQSAGRHVSVPGTTYEGGTVSDGNCIRAVATDRVQISGCASFSAESAITIPFSSIAFITDAPRDPYVTIFLRR